MTCPTDWIAKISHDLRRVSESLVSVSRRLHEYTRKLGDAVEGQFAPEASDPRVRLLNEALQISSMADLQLSRIGVELVRITEDWQYESSHFLAGMADRPREPAVGTTALEQEHNELATLYEITRELNSTHEFDSVLQLVMGRVIRFVNAERGFLMLINPETKEPEFTIARDERSQPIARSAFTISQNTVKRVISTHEPALINDTQADEAFKKQESILAHNIRSIMCAPLLVRGDCIGAVYVDRRFTRTLFASRHRELLLSFCNQAAIAIDNARLFADLNRTMKRVREDKQYMDNIFGSIANGVVTTNSAGIVTTFNAAAGVILSLHPDQIMGRHYTEAFESLPQVGLVALLNQADTLHEHGTLVNQTIECTIPERRGIVSLNCYACSLRDTQGTHIGIALVIDDQTSIKQSKKQAEEIRRLFEQYVHPNVVRQLIQDPQALKLGGETKEISVVFADIRGYTSLGESMPPNKVMDLINGYLKIMCDAIWEEEGTLTAFQGDALMAIFNAPLPQSMHALHAVRAAWKMRMAVLAYQHSLPKELHVFFGFGVNTGLATVGNVGAKGRLQNYTAIGDVINVASRLQSNATNNDIYISNSTYTQVQPHVLVSPSFPLNAKGKTVPLTVRRLLGPA